MDTAVRLPNEADPDQQMPATKIIAWLKQFPWAALYADMRRIKQVFVVDMNDVVLQLKPQSYDIGSGRFSRYVYDYVYLITKDGLLVEGTVKTSYEKKRLFREPVEIPLTIKVNGVVGEDHTVALTIQDWDERLRGQIQYVMFHSAMRKAIIIYKLKKSATFPGVAKPIE